MHIKRRSLFSTTRILLSDDFQEEDVPQTAILSLTLVNVKIDIIIKQVDSDVGC